MAFSASNMVLWADGNAEKLYKYTTSSDSMATVLADGYFDSFDEQCQTGDVVFIEATDSSALYTMTVITDDIELTPLSYEAPVFTASTGTNLRAFGTHRITSTAAATYILDDPVVGSTVTLYNDAGTTTINTVLLASTTVFFDGSNRKIEFNGVDETVTLRGLTSTLWGPVASLNSPSLATT